MKILVSVFDIEKTDKLDKIPEKFSHIRNDFNRGLEGKDNFSLSKIKTFRNEISIRRLTIEEARPILEKYLDDAYLLGVIKFLISNHSGLEIQKKEGLELQLRILRNNHSSCFLYFSLSMFIKD